MKIVKKLNVYLQNTLFVFQSYRKPEFTINASSPHCHLPVSGRTTYLCPVRLLPWMAVMTISLAILRVYSNVKHFDTLNHCVRAGTLYICTRSHNGGFV